MVGTTVGTTPRWWRRVFYLGVMVTLLGYLKGYVLPVLNEVNDELGTNFQINNVMWFVVLPSLMVVTIALDRVIIYLMIATVGFFTYAISQGACTEPDIVIGIIRCGSNVMHGAKADAVDLFHRRDDILAASFHWGHELGSLLLRFAFVVVGGLLLLVLLNWAENLYLLWKERKETPQQPTGQDVLPLRRKWR